MNLLNFMKKKSIDFSIFINDDSSNHDINLQYYAKYNGSGALIVLKSGKQFLMVPAMEKDKAFGEKYVFKKFYEDLSVVLKNKKINPINIGADFESISFNQFKRLRKNLKSKFVDISKTILEERSIKKTDELLYIKKSCAIASDILNRCIINFKKFKTEQDVHDFLEIETKKKGCIPSFTPIVASGKGSSIPHYEDHKKLQDGFCVLDFGVKFKGYCSDISRTIYLGKPTKKEIEDYNLLLKVQKDAINFVKDGMNAITLDKFVRKGLGDKEKYFIHGLGHGVGLEIHESPGISSQSKGRIKKGMAFTIEPGIYYSNKYGIRIEDTVYLGKKIEILTKIKKELIII